MPPNNMSSITSPSASSPSPSASAGTPRSPPITYLKNATLVGEHLCYVAEYQGAWLALLGWSAPARHLRPRDAWIGWSKDQLAARRHFLANNARFCILADPHQLPNLASRALALCTARLSADWQARWGHPIVAVESFVDGQLFRGTAYKAAGWKRLDDTSGYARVAEDFYQRHDRPKQLWVRALEDKAFRALRAQTLLPAGVLLLADRLHGGAAFAAAALDVCTKVGSPFLIRARSNIRVQVIKRFKDGSRLVGVPGRQKGQPRHSSGGSKCAKSACACSAKVIAPRRCACGPACWIPTRLPPGNGSNSMREARNPSCITGN
jgi:hypothetical protein